MIYAHNLSTQEMKGPKFKAILWLHSEFKASWDKTLSKRLEMNALIEKINKNNVNIFKVVWRGGSVVKSTCYSCKAPRSVPSTHLVAHHHPNSCSRDSNMDSVLCGHCIHVVCEYIHIHTGNILICKTDKSFKKLR